MGSRLSLAALALTVWVAAPMSADGDPVRVAIEKDAGIVTVSSTAPFSASCGTEGPLHFIDGAKLATARPARGGMTINGHSTACRTVTMKSEDGAIRIGAKGYPGVMVIALEGVGLTVVNHVDLEDYVAGVIMAEMGPDWPLEALKAQAVASRTFARYRMERNGGKLYDLDDTVRSQVYAGAAGEGMDRIREAVEATRGVIAVYDGAPAGTFYHSSSGGRTENLGDVWGRRAVPYLVSKPALFEERSPHHNWRLRMSAKEITNQLKKAGIGAGPVVSIETLSHTSSGRVGRLRLVCGNGRKKIEMRGENFRKIIGDRRLPSTKFKVTGSSGGMFTFTGQGYGHGVGMSQWSARGLAERGRGYEEIIQAFYPGVALEPIFKEPVRMDQAPSPEPLVEPEKEETLAASAGQTPDAQNPEPMAD